MSAQSKLHKVPHIFGPMGSLAVLSTTLVSCIVCVISIWLTRRNAKRFSLSHMLPFPLRSQYFPNCFQCILIFDPGSSRFIQKASTTTTLRKTLDPLHLLFSEKRSFFYINLSLAHKVPCFYVFRRSSNFRHAGKSLSKPYLLNKSKYAMLGGISEKIHDFCLKYSVEHFYCSYLPLELFDRDLKASFVEIKVDLSEATEEFASEFVELFDSVSYEPENKYQRIVKEFGLMRRTTKALDSPRSWIERLS